MVDVANLGAAPTADDFVFRAGRGGDPSAWALAATPAISVRRGAGTSGTDRVSFTWPDVPGGQPDNIGTDGGQLTLKLPATATRLAFIGSASNGDQQGTATLAYTDGTTESIDLSFSDWTLGGGGGDLKFGNVVVAKTGHRNEAGGGSDPIATYMFATKPVPLAAGKQVAAVKLPQSMDIHVFAVAAG